MSDSPFLGPKTPDLVWFRGSDAVRFLNDLISQEVEALDPGRVRRSLLLGPQGKMDHVLWALRGEEEVGLVTETGRGGELAQTLGRYRIRVDVEIEPEAEPLWLVVGGHNLEEGTWLRDDRGLVADISLFGLRQTLMGGERPDLPELTPEAYDILRIRAGEPAWGVDVNEKTIPQETGLVETTVDFTKGCYLGQELVARIDSRGHVNKHLRIIELDADVSVPVPITNDGEEVGTLTSVGDRVGLAMVRREIDPGDRVRVGETEAVVRPLPQNSQT